MATISQQACWADTHLDDPFHHAHHLVDNSNGLMCALCRADVGPVLAGQYIPACHVQHICRRQLKVNCRAIGIVYNGRQKRIFRCKKILERRKMNRNVIWRKVGQELIHQQQVLKGLTAFPEFNAGRQYQLRPSRILGSKRKTDIT